MRVCAGASWYKYSRSSTGNFMQLCWDKLEINSAGRWPSRNKIMHPCFNWSDSEAIDPRVRAFLSSSFASSLWTLQLCLRIFSRIHRASFIILVASSVFPPVWLDRFNSSKNSMWVKMERCNWWARWRKTFQEEIGFEISAGSSGFTLYLS